MNQPLFAYLFGLTLQSFLYWMFATLFIALVGYVALYVWDRDVANQYRSLWRKGYYLTFGAFVLFGFIVGEFAIDAAWTLAGIAILIVVLDYGVLGARERQDVIEEDLIEEDMTKPLTEER
ncbi:hypothetical protein [Exiguobacterium aurantiacum]|uniref:hypothetical protein n=1 Tax=Exiguobacterium aurantiacum TaxID=33987 RepID=UPI0008778449|nr:hypothetical protein [Exiguobacterium aurantiacum]